MSDAADAPTQGQHEEPSSGPRHVEQLALATLALLFGLIGLAVHVLWFVSIVLMAIQLGLLASEFGSRRGGKGIISEVTHEVATVVEEIKSGSSDDNNHAIASSAAADPETAPAA
jgi:hypothetical protein